MKPITIKMDDKPHLTKLMQEDKRAYNELMHTMIWLAEDIANAERRVPWYKLPGLLHEDLTFRELMEAVVEAFFDAEKLNPDTFDVMGVDLHPLSLLKKQESGRTKYTKWKSHFGMPENAKVDKESIKDIIRTMLYYSKYIDVERFGKAMMSNQLEAHKALPEPSMEKLPFHPALKYQQKIVGDLNVGKFWPVVGAFYGGGLKEIPETCPACQIGKMVEVTKVALGIHVCDSCNIGIKKTDVSV